MPTRSAGLLLYRVSDGTLEVFLVHPGGPFWASKDEHAWSIPKGEFGSDEEPLAAAQRELTEETRCVAPGPFIDLGFIKQRSGKTVFAWASPGECDAARIQSNTVMIEWPPRSGRRLEIPEVDRGGWFGVDQAKQKLIVAQAEFVDRLCAALGVSTPPDS